MRDKYVVTGILTSEKTVTLDNPIPLESQKVRLIVEPLANETQHSYREVLARIRDRQRERGHHPPIKQASKKSMPTCKT